MFQLLNKRTALFIGMAATWFFIFPRPVLASDLPTKPHQLETPKYREDADNWLGDIARAVGVAVLLAGIGAGAIITVRKYFPSRIAAMSRGNMKLQVLERLRLAPKTTVYILKYNQHKVMLAVNGEAVSMQLLNSEIDSHEGEG